MRKCMVLVFELVCVLSLVGCGREVSLRKGDVGMQYFFAAKVVEVHEEYLLLEVFDTGNTKLSEGAAVEVSINVASADGCPEFTADEFARVIMERNTDDDPPERLEALFIYKTDETGKSIAD